MCFGNHFHWLLCPACKSLSCSSNCLIKPLWVICKYTKKGCFNIAFTLDACNNESLKVSGTRTVVQLKLLVILKSGQVTDREGDKYEPTTFKFEIVDGIWIWQCAGHKGSCITGKSIQSLVVEISMHNLGTCDWTFLRLFLQDLVPCFVLRILILNLMMFEKNVWKSLFY